MVLTDTHAHLYSSKFDIDRPDMMERAFRSGVERIFLPNIDSGNIAAMLDLCQAYPGKCFPMMGLHPCSVRNNVEDELAIAEDWLFRKETPVPFVAVGEIGIDLYWDKSTLDLQRQAFERQINWAKKLNLPVVIHARDAFDEIFEVTDRLHDDNLRGIFHCFTGTAEHARKIMSYRSFLMGIGGVVTFKKAGLDLVVADIPMEYLVLETDAPYLAPSPHRGKRNESGYLTHVAHKLAKIKGLSPEEVATLTTENSKRMFGV